ncbi:MAG: hypothetical protein V4694_02865 [Pseudomonadota bacterium]
MSKFVTGAMESIGKAIGAIPKNLNEQIADCKAELAELKGDGTIISAMISFAKESGKAMFSAASSSDNSKQDPNEKENKIKELEVKLADLLEQKKAQGQDSDDPSSDSLDGLSEDELDGELGDYVNQLKEDGTPYEVVRKNGMIGIKTTTRGGDPNSMTGMLNSMMKKMGESMLDSASSSLENSSLDDKTKSQVGEVLSGLKRAMGGKPASKKAETSGQESSEVESQEQDDKEWYDGDQVLAETRKGAEMDRDDKNSHSELLGITQAEIFEMQIENAKAIADKGKTALMPINIGGNHWVAGAMTKDKEGNYQMIHNDSLGNPMDKDLADTLGKSGVGIVDLQQLQQSDSYNCGPCAADNLVKFSKAIETSKESGVDITSEEFKEGLSEELGKDGAEIRRSQSLSPPMTPPVAGRESNVRGG